MRTTIWTLTLALLISTSALARDDRRCGPRSREDFDLGVRDGFALPAEPTSPSGELVAYTQDFWPQPATRSCDDGGNDRALIHTFRGWSGPVCGAVLHIVLKGQSSSLSTNDSVRLELIGDPDPQQAFRYWTTIRFVTGSWGPGSRAELELDLSDLPPYGGFPTNLLEDLDDGDLDLLVEDDTAVDTARLTVCRCEDLPVAQEHATPGPAGLEPRSWGRTKVVYASSE